MSFNFSDDDPDAAEAQFLQWWSRVSGTPLDDTAAVLQGLQDTANGGAETVAVPGTEGTTVVGSQEPVGASGAAPEGEPRTYTAHDLHMAKLDAAEKYGVTREKLRDYLDLLQGTTPDEIAAYAAKLDAVTARALARQPDYDPYAHMTPVEAGAAHFLKNFPR